MIYVCIPSYNEAPTVGLLLWKIRQVFAGFPREYQLLVLDDGSEDGTAEVLERYTRVLPLTVTRHEERRGYAISVEELLRQAVERTDRPKRDSALLMHADFAHGPMFIPDLVRRIESGADIVIAQSKLEGEPSRARRLVRRLAPVLLRRIVPVPGVRDVVSGFSIFRLVVLRNAFRSQPGPFLTTQGWAANAELYGRTVRYARRLETIEAVERRDLRQRPSRTNTWDSAVSIIRSRGPLRQLPAWPVGRDSNVPAEHGRAEVASS
ncbi:MAG TPA: glycosyltransferase family 2 protein [Gemmatimonadales bacterium]|nr:glycosyltransferase family 2 protein [Gemmatimonadales bacterium]